MRSADETCVMTLIANRERHARRDRSHLRIFLRPTNEFPHVAQLVSFRRILADSTLLSSFAFVVVGQSNDQFEPNRAAEHR